MPSKRCICSTTMCKNCRNVLAVLLGRICRSCFLANVLQSSVSGNLELNITDDELKKIFGRYGKVEDVDIKRPPPNSGETYFHIF